MSAAAVAVARARSGRSADRSPYLKGVLRAFRQPLGAICLVALTLLIVAAVGAPAITRYEPNAQLRQQQLLPPSADHWFGTDELGRDLFSRVIYGLRVSLAAGVLSTTIGIVSGSALGMIAGYRQGWLGTVIMRLVDALLAFPGILFGIAIIAVLGPGLRNVTITIAVVTIPIFARLAYSSVLAEKHRDYVQAAIALGAFGHRILFGHILINILPPLVVQFALAMGFSVLLEASLSFLGLGIPLPNPSLGSVFQSSRRFMRDAVYYPLFPGVVLSILILGLNALADTLNIGLNPHAKRR